MPWRRWAKALGRARVSIEGGGAWVVGGEGIAHFLFRDGTAARQVLEAAGIQVTAEREVLVQRLKQAVPGQLGPLTRWMAAAILTYPTQFKDRLDRPMILLPWAGDQANMILLPKPGETYAQARAYLPVEAARAWHRQEFNGIARLAAGEGQRRSWRELLGGARWVIGWAGGDDDGHSYLLVANIRAGDRGFLTVAGWGWGRALDAQEADYVRAEDTVLPNEDYHGLDSPYQNGFRPLDNVLLAVIAMQMLVFG